MNRTKCVKYVVLALLLTVSATFSGTTFAGANDIVVIVNSANGASSMSADELKSVFMGSKKFWSGQSRVTLFTRPADHASTLGFFTDVLGTSPSRYRLHWKKLELGGEGVEPPPISDGAGTVAKVAGESGAIGYLLRSELDASGGGGVKVVFTLTK